MTGNLKTLADAREFVKRYVDNGSCNNTVIDARIAEAEQRLWPKIDQRQALRRMRIRVSNRTFPLPFEVEKILKVDIDGSPARVYGPMYEYMSSGLGDLDERGVVSSNKELVDCGEFPVMFDIPVKAVATATTDTLCDAVVEAGYTLVAFSDQALDANQSVSVRGANHQGDEIWTIDGLVRSPGESIQINRWHGGVEGQIYGTWADLHTSEHLYSSISQVVKPVTSGPVTLYAVNTTTHAMFLLSKMVPEATVPSYRRYRILNQACTDDCSSILALVKIRFRAAARADDVMCIQNLSALRLMIQALKVETDGDIPGAHTIEAKAFAILLDEKQNRDDNADSTVSLDYDYRFSPGAVNHGYNV